MGLLSFETDLVHFVAMNETIGTQLKGGKGIKIPVKTESKSTQLEIENGRVRQEDDDALHF